MEEVLKKLRYKIVKEIVAVNIGINLARGLDDIKHSKYEGKKEALDVVMEFIEELA